MIGRVKQWLGIEGVKLELLIPEEISAKDNRIEGRVRFQSMNTQQVVRIKLVFIERYSRGRGDEKRIDEYELGTMTIEKEIPIPAGELIEVPFSLPFSLVRSEMDEFGGKNPLFSGIVKAAKMLSAVHSEYRVEAEAKVKGTALNPFDKKEVSIK